MANLNNLIYTSMNTFNPTQTNTLFLIIRKEPFDQIIKRIKTTECRHIKESTKGRYLQRDNYNKLILNPTVDASQVTGSINEYNNGIFPYLPLEYKFMNLAVGYAKKLDNILVEIVDISFEPREIRGNIFTDWYIIYHLGEIIKLWKR